MLSGARASAERSQGSTHAVGGTWPYDQERYDPIMNLAVGGESPGAPDEATQFPRHMEIDYLGFYDEA